MQVTSIQGIVLSKTPDLDELPVWPDYHLCCRISSGRNWAVNFIFDYLLEVNLIPPENSMTYYFCLIKHSHHYLGIFEIFLRKKYTARFFNNQTDEPHRNFERYLLEKTPPKFTNDHFFNIALACYLQDLRSN